MGEGQDRAWQHSLPFKIEDSVTKQTSQMGHKDVGSCRFTDIVHLSFLGVH